MFLCCHCTDAKSVTDLEQKADARKGKTFAWYFESPRVNLGNCIPVKSVASK